MINIKSDLIDRDQLELIMAKKISVLIFNQKPYYPLKNHVTLGQYSFPNRNYFVIVAQKTFLSPPMLKWSGISPTSLSASISVLSGIVGIP